MSDTNEPMPALGSLRYDRDRAEEIWGGAKVLTKPWWTAVSAEDSKASEHERPMLALSVGTPRGAAEEYHHRANYRPF